MASTWLSLRLSMGEGEGEQENEGENDDIHLTCATSRPLVSPDEARLGWMSRGDQKPKVESSSILPFLCL